MILRGVPVVPGVAFGPTVVVARAASSRELPDEARARLAGLDETTAMQRYDAAAAAVAGTLTAEAAGRTGAAAEVLAATAVLARDPGLRAAVRHHLGSGCDLLQAVRAAGEQLAVRLAGAGAADRVPDLHDVGDRIVAELAGVPLRVGALVTAAAVVVADDLAPADAATLDPTRVLGLVLEGSTPSGHTAVIARELGIPCVVGVRGCLAVGPGAVVLVDGGTGQVEVAPDDKVARGRVARARADAVARSSWAGPGVTADGEPVALLANISDLDGARAAAAGPVEGAGLFRTELCFLGRAEEPSVDEQARLYADVLRVMGPHRPVVLRTLDVGSDKPAAFLSAPVEPNPALGSRGLRLAAADPGLLERQLDAIALAARRSGTTPSVMAPMVATVEEARDFAARARVRGLRAGVMVEVPSAAIQARRLLAEVDFASVGTNDLAQYAMAADRNARDLAHLTDPWQPAVLQLVEMTAHAGVTSGKPVGVCGEAAADPLLAVVLVGLGITSLSMAVTAVPAVGLALAQTTTHACREGARVALAADDPDSARAAVRQVLGVDGV